MSLREKLAAFFEPRFARRRAPALEGTRGKVRPLRDLDDVRMPWRVLTLASILLPSFRVKGGIRFLATTGVLRPGCEGGMKIVRPRALAQIGNASQRLRRLAEEELDAPDITGDELREAEHEDNASHSWRLRPESQWLRTWREVHKYVMPAKARQTWWQILHKRGPVFRRSQTDFRTGPCQLCGSRDTHPDHLYASCELGMERWHAMSAVLRLLLPGVSDTDRFLSERALDRMTGFPSLSSGLDFAGKLRLRLWYLLCLHQFSSAIYKAGAASTDGTRTPAAFDTSRMVSGVVRDVIRWLAWSKTSWETAKFDERWIAGNNLVLDGSLQLTPQAIGLLGATSQDVGETAVDEAEVATQAPSAPLDSATASPADDSPSRSVAVAEPRLEGDALRDPNLAASSTASQGAPVTAPERQQWTVGSRLHTCNCCRSRKARREETTRLCPICFRTNTGVMPNFPGATMSLAKGFCNRCGAMGNCVQQDSTQNWPKKLVGDPCHCCQNPVRLVESLTRLCRGCFEAHTGRTPTGARRVPARCDKCPTRHPSLPSNQPSVASYFQARRAEGSSKD